MQSARKISTAADASAVAPTSFFDSPFTASSNRLLESIYADGNTNPSTRLLLFIARFSTGYLKPEAILKESFILEITGMSRSSLYKAKKELIDTGKITIGHTQTGNCIYRLVPELQCLKGFSAAVPTAAEKARERWGPATGDPPRPRLETPHVYKEIQENYNHHQAPLEPTLSTNDDVSLIHLKVSRRNAENSSIHKVSPPNVSTSKAEIVEVGFALNEKQSALATRLRHFAVTKRLAENLVLTNPSDIIEKALAGLTARKEIINPAGWLVREIQSGGYLPPKGVVAEQTRRAVELSRAAEKAAVEADRDHQETAAAADLAELDQLSAERFSKLLEAARAKMAWLPKAATANADNPFIRGAMLDLLREVRLQQ